MLDDDDDDEDDDNTLFVKPKPSRAPAKKPAVKAPARNKSPPKKAAPRAAKQSTLNFSQTSIRPSRQPASTAKPKKVVQEPVCNPN